MSGFFFELLQTIILVIYEQSLCFSYLYFYNL